MSNREAYDHELSGKKAEREAGYNEGYDEGYDEALSKVHNDIVKNMFTKGLTSKEISDLTNIPLKEIDYIISSIESDHKNN